MEQIDEILSNIPGYSSLPVTMKQTALGLSLIPDSNGVWPAQPGYVSTYDYYYAASILLGYLKAQPYVSSVSSEGTSVSTTAPDWSALAKSFASMSIILSNQGIFTKVSIPEGPYIVPTDMAGRGSRYGDTNTDIG